jgi:hypothetical protein
MAKLADGGCAQCTIHRASAGSRTQVNMLIMQPKRINDHSAATIYLRTMRTFTTGNYYMGASSVRSIDSSVTWAYLGGGRFRRTASIP